MDLALELEDLTGKLDFLRFGFDEVNKLLLHYVSCFLSLSLSLTIDECLTQRRRLSS